jgi:predicted enzyme related to lactoylglutathione lyase
MAEWEKQISAMTLLVGDLARSKMFYREVFGLAATVPSSDGRNAGANAATA